MQAVLSLLAKSLNLQLLMLLCSFFVICKVFWTPLFCSFFVIFFLDTDDVVLFYLCSVVFDSTNVALFLLW